MHTFLNGGGLNPPPSTPQTPSLATPLSVPVKEVMKISHYFQADMTKNHWLLTYWGDPVFRVLY